MHSMRQNQRAIRRVRGFTLLELMIALTIGIFLLGALMIIVQTNRTVFGNQNKLAQLHDSERMAMTMLTDVIQSAGYFPDPTINTQAGTFLAVAPFGGGESINGLSAAGPPVDQISVRYMTASGDGILNCSGLPNTSGSPQIYVNKFQIINNQLVCTMNTQQYNLVSGVTNMEIWYGVKYNVATAGNDADTYMTASQIVGLWSSVVNVMVKLTLINPLYDGTPKQPQFVTIQRVIGVMNQNGPVR